MRYTKTAREFCCPALADLCDSETVSFRDYADLGLRLRVEFGVREIYNFTFCPFCGARIEVAD